MSNHNTVPVWRTKRGVISIIGIVGGVLALVIVGLLTATQATRSTQGEHPTFAVAKGPLTISVTESGTITASQQEIVKNEVEGRTTIIWLIDEGVRVKPGDLLVELDSSALQTQLADQEITVRNAEAAAIQAEEEYAVAENQARSDLSKAELDHRFAVEDLTKYVEGEVPNLRKQAETEITLKTEALKTAEDKLTWSKKLFEEKYISKRELDTDTTAANRARLELELAEQALALLNDYTIPRQIAQLESNIEQMALALERTRRSARAAVVQKEALMLAKQSELRRAREKKAKLEDQIAKCRITAPVAGMVVYSTTGKANWRGNETPLDEGTEVRERQELIYLPTAAALQAEIKVHESSLDKVTVGQPVRITVDALPGKTFRGRVAKISPLPDAQSMWMNPDLKVYATTINLEGDLEEVRTGMTCRAEVIVDHYPEAMYVPVQAVVRVGEQPTVYVRRGDRFDPRPVELGLSNNRMVRVLSGVEPGEVVTLTPPLAQGTAEPKFVFNDRAPADEAASLLADAGTAGKVKPVEKTAEATPPAAEGDRAEWRKRMESMSPEERQKMREQWQQRRGGGEAAGPAAGGAG